MSSLLCFETDKLRNLFLQIYPVQSATTTTFKELLGSLYPDVKDISKPSELTDKEYDIIQMLRESLILNSTHVDHAQSLIPKTPRSIRLFQQLKKYIEEDSSKDFTYYAWLAIGLFKENNQYKINPITENEVVFISAEEPSFLFSEFITAFSYLENHLSRQLSFAKFTEGSSDNPIEVVRTGTEVALLDNLAHEAFLKKQSGFRILIPFLGTETDRLYLCAKLSHYNLKFSDFTSNTERLNLKNEQTAALESLRKNRTLPLAEKLKLTKLILLETKNKLLLTSLKDFLTNLLERKLITEIQHIFLSTLPATTVDSYSANDNSDVLILPWVPLPYSKNDFTLSFCTQDEYFQKEEETLLTPNEIEALFQGGFHIPTFRNRINSQNKTLKHFESNQDTVIFTSLETSHFNKCVAIDTLPNPDLNKSLLTEPLPQFAPKTFSASQLETYTKCPSLYFFQNRLRLKKEQQFEKQKALILGQATHLALEKFFKEKQPDQPLETYFLNALKTEYPSLSIQSPFYRSLIYSFKKIASHIAKLQSELQNLFPGITQVHFEKEFTLQVGPHTFRGKIDRIDQTATGSYLILDYKTGNVDFTPDHIRQGIHFQALIYVLEATTNLKESFAGFLFFDLKKGELRRGLVAEEYVSLEAKKAFTRGHTLASDKLRSLLEIGEKLLNEKCKLIQEGVFAPTPSDESCDYCDFTALCRAGVNYV